MSENDRAVDDTESTLVSGEDSGWFVDCDMSLSSSCSDGDKICRLIREKVNMTLNFLILAKSEDRFGRK